MGEQTVKATTKMLGIALAASTALGTAAQAQRDYGNTAPQTPPQARGAEQPKEKPSKGGAATVTIGDRKIKVSAGFTKAYQELLAAIEANDTANIPAKVAAAHAAAQSGDEHFLASQAQLKVAVAQKNDAEIATSIEGLISSGSMPQDQLGSLYVNLGKTRYNLKQYPQAIAAFEKAQQLDPKNAEIIPLLAQARSVGGNPNDAVATLRQAIAQQSANGAKAPEDMRGSRSRRSRAAESLISASRSPSGPASSPASSTPGRSSGAASRDRFRTSWRSLSRARSVATS